MRKVAVVTQRNPLLPGPTTSSGSCARQRRRWRLAHRLALGWFRMSIHKSPTSSMTTRGTCLRQHFREKNGRVAKRAYVRSTGVREKGAMAFAECQGLTPFDTIEASVWRETLKGCLGSLDRRDLIGGLCHATGSHDRTIGLHTFTCRTLGWNILACSQMLRECSLIIAVGGAQGNDVHI